MEICPLIIIGDMNTSLPKQQINHRNWYNKRPYTKHSSVLNEFVLSYNLAVANFSFDHDVTYTIFNNVSRTYIDHVLVPGYSVNVIRRCSIQSDLALNTSDHFPISTTINLIVPEKDKFGKNGIEHVPSSFFRF